MRSGQSFKKIDELTVGEHAHLLPIYKSYACLYLREYIPHRHYKEHDKQPEMFCYNFMDFKELGNKKRPRVIQTFATELAEALTPILTKVKKYTITPAPPSKSRAHPEFDNRVRELLDLTNQRLGGTLDIQELVIAAKDRTPSHVGGGRHSLESLVDCLDVVEDAEIGKGGIIVFDDALTRGTTFAAHVQLLSDVYPNTPIVGMFFARTVHPFG